MKTFPGLLLTALILFLPAISMAQFEGVIEFRKHTTIDSITYIYYIKGNKVRLDEIGVRSRRVEGTYIVDLKEKKIVVVSHDRKLYMDKPQTTPGQPAGSPEVIKTKNTRTIQGYKCTEYVVKNTADNTQVSYWITNGKFDFFDPFLKLVTRKEKLITYYRMLNMGDGSFPMLAVETVLTTGKVSGSMEATKVEKKTLDAALFEVPKGYEKVKD